MVITVLIQVSTQDANKKNFIYMNLKQFSYSLILMNYKNLINVVLNLLKDHLFSFLLYPLVLWQLFMFFLFIYY